MVWEANPLYLDLWQNRCISADLSRFVHLSSFYRIGDLLLDEVLDQVAKYTMHGGELELGSMSLDGPAVVETQLDISRSESLEQVVQIYIGQMVKPTTWLRGTKRTCFP